jgi:signal peptidase I
MPWRRDVVRTCVGAAAVLGLVFLRRRYTTVTVNGTSMEPALDAGDRVLVARIAPERVGVGDIVVCRHPWSTAPPRPSAGADADAPGGGSRPYPRWMVKRVAALPGDSVPAIGMQVQQRVVPAGSLILLGDNREASADSREFGFFSLDQVLGKVVRRLETRVPASGP